MCAAVVHNFNDCRVTVHFILLSSCCVLSMSSALMVLFWAWWCFLWSPYVIEQTIIFLPCGFYLSSFFPRLILAVRDGLSTILPHTAWPSCKFRMHVWNVLHAAHWKYRTQKVAVLAPSHNFVGLYLRSWGMYRQSEKNLLNTDTSSTCPCNMVNLRPTSGWELLASLGHPCKFRRLSHLGSVTARHFSSRRQPNFAALNRGRHLYLARRPSRWALAHILVVFHVVHMPCVCWRTGIWCILCVSSRWRTVGQQSLCVTAVGVVQSGLCSLQCEGTNNSHHYTVCHIFVCNFVENQQILMPFWLLDLEMSGIRDDMNITRVTKCCYTTLYYRIYILKISDIFNIFENVATFSLLWPLIEISL